MNGFLVVDKPSGMTSHDVVARVRRILGEKSVGHLGTLDPIATGVLPLLLGKFTRLAPFFLESTKVYEGVIRWGMTTDTYDSDGEQTSVYSGPLLSTEDDAINAIIAAELLGDIDQVPPPFSAKKISGVPAYKLARAGKAVELKTKQVHVEKFEVGDPKPAGVTKFELSHGPFADFLVSTFTVECSAGTYVRSLVHDLGQKLGCGAHVLELRRTRSGEFHIDQAWTLEQLEKWQENGYTAPWGNIHPRQVLQHLPAVTATPDVLPKINHGHAVNLPFFNREARAGQLVRVFKNNEELIAIARRVAGTLFQPKIVLI